MKRIVSFAAIVVLMSSAAAVARDQGEPRACTTETLEGSYGISISGARPAANFPPGTSEQIIGVGVQTFDGDGNVTQTTIEKGSLNGLGPARNATGTYTVNADCTGAITLHVVGVPFAVVFDIVIVNRGREIDAFVASPAASMVSTVAKRVN